MLIDGELAESCRGKPGIGVLNTLSHRDGMLERFRVSPCVVRYCYFRSPFGPALGGNAISAVISSPDLYVFAVAAAGGLCAFPARRTRYLDSVSAAEPAHLPSSLPLLELGDYNVNGIRLHVAAADALVRRGVDGDDSR